MSMGEQRRQLQDKKLGVSSWILYMCLLLWRVVVCTSLPGYVHPDEFFQGGQELWFGCPPFTPWEFEAQHKLRSIVPPTIMTRFPLWIYEKGGIGMSGKELLVVPRLFCALLSIATIDTSVWFLSSQKEREVPTSVLVLASAWPAWVLLTRPFTNTMETMILALLMFVTCSCTRAKSSWKRGFLVGMLCSMGVFTRFTFVCFGFPTVFQYLVEQISTSRVAEPSKQGHFLDACRAFLITVLPLGIGFCLAAIGFVFADFDFYRARSAHDTESIRAYLTPINALVYNSQVDNLRHHGLHPLWTHSLVNMHILYGPLALVFYAALVQSFLFRKKRRNKQTTDDGGGRDSRVRSVCVWTIASGVGLLSCAPHQEPRFLLPLLVPLVILGGNWIASSRRVVVLAWVIFNTILFIVFGVLHQGGVVPSLVLSPQDRPKARLYFRTYMPPTFLSRKTAVNRCGAESQTTEADAVCFGEQLGDATTCPEYPIVDLKGASFRDMRATLGRYLNCYTGEVHPENHVHLVSPPLADTDENEEIILSPTRCSVGSAFDCVPIRTHSLHLTTEDFPPFQGSILDLAKDLKLGVYVITCRSPATTQR